LIRCSCHCPKLICNRISTTKPTQKKYFEDQDQLSKATFFQFIIPFHQDKKRGTPLNPTPPPLPAQRAPEAPLVPVAATIAAPHRLKSLPMPTRTGRSCRRLRRPASAAAAGAHAGPHQPRPPQPMPSNACRDHCRPHRPAPATATTAQACRSHRRTRRPPPAIATGSRVRAHAHTRALAAQPPKPGETGRIRDHPPPLAMETPMSASFREGARRPRPPHPARSGDKRPRAAVFGLLVASRGPSGGGAMVQRRKVEEEWGGDARVWGRSIVAWGRHEQTLVLFRHPLSLSRERGGDGLGGARLSARDVVAPPAEHRSAWRRCPYALFR
jgi:hypothetical protein